MKSGSGRRMTAFLLLLVCVPAYAGQRSRPRTGAAQAKARQEAQAREQRRKDEEYVRNLPDPGSDLAFIVAPRANILEAPSASSRVLQAGERGEVLSLVEREPVGTWYKVIHVESAIEGWIDESAVIIKLTANRYNAPPLEAEDTGTDRNPEITVSNLEPSTDLNLRISGTRHVVRANSTRTLTLKPGRYEYYAWSPGVRPAIGAHSLRVGFKYSWTFRIVRR